MADKLRDAIVEFLEDNPDYTANSLSLKAGLNRNSVGQILEKKSRNPRVDTLRNIARVLKVHPSLLIDD